MIRLVHILEGISANLETAEGAALIPDGPVVARGLDGDQGGEEKGAHITSFIRLRLIMAWSIPACSLPRSWRHSITASSMVPGQMRR